VTPTRIGGRPAPPARSAESRTAPPSTPAARVDDFRETFTRLRTELGNVIVGQADVLEQILIALFAGGHVLIEGVPGTGKTLIVRTLGQALNLSFNRIQFTIDLMPADITGTRILTEQDGQREMVFARGPVFAHVLLADEINRATPKTQSALLEAMAERQVTVAGTTHKLAAPFFVLATLNPIEMEGTYPLPEAQLDRFLFKVFLPYPSTSEMQRIIGSTTGADLAEARPVFAPRRAASRVEELKTLVREVLVAPHLEEYAAALVRATIPRSAKFAPAGPSSLPPDELVSRYVSFGSSPRGGQALLLGAKVRALLAGRVNITYEDIDRVAIPALNHRLVLNFAARADDVDPRTLIQRLLDAAKRLHR
jgi:MoxR-like ATPase